MMLDRILVDKVDVGIVGGGGTGQFVALELADRGISCQIAESRSEIGGRVRDGLLKEYEVNIGPNWLHPYNGDLDQNSSLQWMRGRYTHPAWMKYDVDGVFQDVDQHFVLDRVTNAITFWIDGSISGNEIYNDVRQFVKAEWQAYEGNRHLCSTADLVRNNIEAKLVMDYGARNWMGLKSARHYSAMEYFEDLVGDGGRVPMKSMRDFFAPVRFEIAERKIPVVTNYHIKSVVRQANGEYLFDDGGGRKFRARCALLTPPETALKNIHIEPAPTREIAARRGDIIPTYMEEIIVLLTPQFFEQRGIKPNTHIRLFNVEPSLFVFACPAGKPYMILFAGGELGEQAAFWSQEQTDAFVAKTLSSTPQLFGGFEKHLQAPALQSRFAASLESLCSYSAVKIGGRKPDRPLGHKGLFYANSDYVGLSEGGGTLCATGIAAHKVVPMIEAYLSSGPR
jgi:hypothetical protein